MNEHYQSNANITKRLNYLPQKTKIMIEINKEQREIKITLQGDCGTLLNMQASIINCIKYYNFSEYPASTGEFYYLLGLLEAMLLDEDQVERAFTVEGKHIKLPENLTDMQKLKISEAFFLIAKEQEVNSTNPVFQAIKKVG